MRYREGLGARPGVGREEGPEEKGGASPPFLQLVLGGLCHSFKCRQVSVPSRRFWNLKSVFLSTPAKATLKNFVAHLPLVGAQQMPSCLHTSQQLSPGRAMAQRVGAGISYHLWS